MDFYYGMVEDRNDPLKVGRVRVRVHGVHTHDKQQIATPDLPWSQVMMPNTEASLSGLGHTVHGLVEGSTVIGCFVDSLQQNFVVLGSTLGIPSSGSRRDIEGNLITPTVEDGFNDPRRLTASDYTDTPDGVAPVQDPTRSWGLTQSLEDAPKTPKSVEILTDGTGSTITEKTLTADDLPYYPRYRDITDVNEKSHTTLRPDYKATTLPATVGFTLPADNTTEPKYPFNKTLETESGHYFEIDDTVGREHIVNFHRSGTYNEITNTGDSIYRHVNDHYEVICKDENVYIGGNAILHVESGNITINVQTGNASINVGGNVSATIGGSTTITSTEDISMTAPTIAIDGEVTVTKNIVAQGEVTGKEIELSTHVHTEQGDGKDVSKPK